VLQQCAAQDFTPGFISDHNYMFDPGHENDANLLLHSALGGGATKTLRYDVTGKAFSTALLRMEVAQ